MLTRAFRSLDLTIIKYSINYDKKDNQKRAGYPHYLAVSNTAEQLETIHKLILLFGFHYLTGNVPRRVVVSLPAKQVNQLDHKLFSSLQPLLSFFQVASCNRNSYSRRSFR